MRLLFILPNIGYGGASKILSFLANEFTAKYTYAIDIIVYQNADILQPMNPDIRIHYIGNQYSKKIIKHVQYIYSIYKVVKKINPDLIISFLNYPNLYSIIVGKLLSIPVIISERGDPYQRRNTFDRVFDIAYNFADGAVFQTEGAKLYFSKRLQKRGVIIPNPITNNIHTTKYSINNSHKIAFVGRFELKQKRQDIMVQSFIFVLDKFPDAELHFYGDGQDELFVKNLVKDLKIDQYVIFHEYVENPSQEIVKSEVYVITSDYEGIPNSLIEAMMLGMPVVSTDCSPGGAKLLIKNNINGIIVNRGDVKGISDAIIKIFNDNELKMKLSNNASKIAIDFPPEKVILKWDNYIHDIYKTYNKCKLRALLKK